VIRRTAGAGGRGLVQLYPAPCGRRSIRRAPAPDAKLYAIGDTGGLKPAGSYRSFDRRCFCEPFPPGTSHKEKVELAVRLRGPPSTGRDDGTRANPVVPGQRRPRRPPFWLLYPCWPAEVALCRLSPSTTRCASGPPPHCCATGRNLARPSSSVFMLLHEWGGGPSAKRMVEGSAPSQSHTTLKKPSHPQPAVAGAAKGKNGIATRKSRPSGRLKV